MTKKNIVSFFPIERICKCRLQDNLEFVQWLCKFYFNMTDNEKINENNSLSKNCFNYDKKENCEDSQKNNFKNLVDNLSINKQKKTQSNEKIILGRENKNDLKNQNKSCEIFIRDNSKLKDQNLLNSKKVFPDKKTKKFNSQCRKEELLFYPKKPVMVNMEKKIEPSFLKNTDRSYEKRKKLSTPLNSEAEICYKDNFNIKKNLKDFSDNEIPSFSDSNTNENIKKKSVENKKFFDSSNLNKNLNSAMNSFVNIKIEDKTCSNCEILKNENLDYKNREFFLEEKIKYYDTKMSEIEKLEKKANELDSQKNYFSSLISKLKEEASNKIKVLSEYLEKFQEERDFYFKKIKEVEEVVKKNEIDDEFKDEILEILYKNN
ncbi:hypothetical protein GVAV_001968 [Gurleya vavrai]